MPSIKYSCMISLVATVTDWISLHGLDLLLTGSQLENASNIILSCTRHLRWNHFAEKFGWHLHLLFAVRMLQNQITRWRNMINRVYMKFTFSIFFLSVYQFPERCFETYYTVQAKHCLECETTDTVPTKISGSQNLFLENIFLVHSSTRKLWYCCSRFCFCI